MNCIIHETCNKPLQKVKMQSNSDDKRWRKSVLHESIKINFKKIFQKNVNKFKSNVNVNQMLI